MSGYSRRRSPLSGLGHDNIGSYSYLYSSPLGSAERDRLGRRFDVPIRSDHLGRDAEYRTEYRTEHRTEYQTGYKNARNTGDAGYQDRNRAGAEDNDRPFSDPSWPDDIDPIDSISNVPETRRGFEQRRPRTPPRHRSESQSQLHPRPGGSGVRRGYGPIPERTGTARYHRGGEMHEPRARRDDPPASFSRSPYASPSRARTTQASMRFVRPEGDRGVSSMPGIEVQFAEPVTHFTLQPKDVGKILDGLQSSGQRKRVPRH